MAGRASFSRCKTLQGGVQLDTDSRLLLTQVHAQHHEPCDDDSGGAIHTDCFHERRLPLRQVDVIAALDDGIGDPALEPLKGVG